MGGGGGRRYPLMAVEQATKNKVRPVLDFRELNKSVECHTERFDRCVCGDTERMAAS